MRLLQFRMTRASAMLVLCLGPGACLGPQDLDRPLSPMVLRSELAGRTIVAGENGAWVTIWLARNGIASRSTAGGAEYGRWWTDANGALCIWWHDEPERCAPVHAARGAHYRWGDTELSVLGVAR
jgi:hypothetical protein